MHKHIIYLASGSGRRFGENKLLYPIKGKQLFLHGLDCLHAFIQKHNDCSLTVVSRYETIRRQASLRGITVTDSPESEKGISYTIKAGLRSLGDIPAEDYIIFVVADQPFLRETSLENLLTCAEQGAECASLAWGDRPGNPTLFSAGLIPELLALEGDTGGRKVLRRHDCVYVQAQSESELEDIDTKGAGMMH